MVHVVLRMSMTHQTVYVMKAGPDEVARDGLFANSSKAITGAFGLLRKEGFVSNECKN